MKSLNELTNTDKAKLIHQLFPEEITGLLDGILDFCADLKERKKEYAAEWSDRSIMTFDYWYSLAIETETLIKRMKYDMVKSRNVFAEQLCFTYTVIFFNVCLVRYAKEKCTNEKFRMAVELLY